MRSPATALAGDQRGAVGVSFRKPARGLGPGLIESHHPNAAQGGGLVSAPAHHIAGVTTGQNPDRQARLGGVVYAKLLFLGLDAREDLGGDLGFHTEASVTAG